MFTTHFGYVKLCTQNILCTNYKKKRFKHMLAKEILACFKPKTRILDFLPEGV